MNDVGIDGVGAGSGAGVDWNARDAERKRALTKAREQHAQAVHQVEAGQHQAAIAYALCALLTIALSHERND